MKHLLFALTALVLAFSGRADAQTYYGLSIQEPTVLAVEAPVTTTIATAVITNLSRRPLTLLRAETDAADLIYVHLTTRAGGVRSMHEVPSVQIGVIRPLVMDDNGYHIMLVHTKGPMVVGRVVRINMVFRQDGRERVIPVDFTVKPYDPLAVPHVH